MPLLDLLPTHKTKSILHLSYLDSTGSQYPLEFILKSYCQSTEL